MGTGALSQEVKGQGSESDNSPPSSAAFKNDGAMELSSTPPYKGEVDCV
jgi:hypothetical protein